MAQSSVRLSAQRRVRRGTSMCLHHPHILFIRSSGLLFLIKAFFLLCHPLYHKGSLQVKYNYKNISNFIQRLDSAQNVSPDNQIWLSLTRGVAEKEAAGPSTQYIKDISGFSGQSGSVSITPPKKTIPDERIPCREDIHRVCGASEGNRTPITSLGN